MLIGSVALICARGGNQWAVSGLAEARVQPPDRVFTSADTQSEVTSLPGPTGPVLKSYALTIRHHLLTQDVCADFSTSKVLTTPIKKVSVSHQLSVHWTLCDLRARSNTTKPNTNVQPAVELGPAPLCFDKARPAADSPSACCDLTIF